MISKIIVPSDGSKTAQKAAAYAVDLAKQLKAAIIVLSVIDQRSLIAQTASASDAPRHTIEPIEDYLREAAEGYAGEIKKLCDKSGVAATISIKKGHRKKLSGRKPILLLWAPMAGALYQPPSWAVFPMASFTMIKVFPSSS